MKGAIPIMGVDLSCSVMNTVQIRSVCYESKPLLAYVSALTADLIRRQRAGKEAGEGGEISYDTAIRIEPDPYRRGEAHRSGR